MKSPRIQIRSLILLLALGLGGCRIHKNFHVVQEGEIYRSAQLTGEEFRLAIDQVGIKTVINLRGKNDAEWYSEESETLRSEGVQLIDISMSAKRFPHRDDLIRLLDAFRTAARPILIHCKAGADRTGEAVALYQMEYLGKSKREALKSLSPYYLHMPSFMPAKRAFIEIYSGEDWARSVYDPCRESYKYYPQSDHCPRPLDPPTLDENDDT
jgi:protein tyrosine/serine phosphatase